MIQIEWKKWIKNKIKSIPSIVRYIYKKCVKHLEAQGNYRNRVYFDIFSWKLNENIAKKKPNRSSYTRFSYKFLI